MHAHELSIIIPFYKGERFIVRLLTSIFSAYERNNGGCVIEIIIIIDCELPVNCLQQLLDKFLSNKELSKIHTYKNERNYGVAETRNIGFDLSTGEYLLFIDQDDAISDTFFYYVSKYLGEKDFIFFNGKIKEIESGIEHRLYYLAPKLNVKKVILKSFIRSPGQVILKRTILSKPLFPATTYHFGADDKFFWIKIFLTNKKLKIVYIPECLYIAYKHSGNYSNDYKELSLSCLELWKQFSLQLDQGGIQRWVKRDIRIQRYIIGDFFSAKDKIRCLMDFLAHKIDINSTIRFSIKKMKGLFK